MLQIAQFQGLSKQNGKDRSRQLQYEVQLGQLRKANCPNLPDWLSSWVHSKQKDGDPV